MKLLIFVGLFLTLPAFGMAPTSEFGLGKDLSPNRELSSSQASFVQQSEVVNAVEFVRVEDDLGLVLRMPLFSNQLTEWKVYPTGFPRVSSEAMNSCEKNYASALQIRMQDILANAKSIQLQELHRYNQNNGLKAWVISDKIKLNQLVNLKVLEGCWQQQRDVAGQ